MNFKIKSVTEKFKGGYIGMDKPAYEKHFGGKYPYSSNTICVYDKLPKEVRKHTIKHEQIEAQLMKNRNMQYKTAHREALKYETDNSRVKTILKKIKR